MRQFQAQQKLHSTSSVLHQTTTVMLSKKNTKRQKNCNCYTVQGFYIYTVFFRFSYLRTNFLLASKYFQKIIRNETNIHSQVRSIPSLQSETFNFQLRDRPQKSSAPVMHEKCKINLLAMASGVKNWHLKCRSIH